MLPFLRRALDSIRTMWANLKSPQKFALLTLATLLGLVLVMFLRVGPADGMKELAGLGVPPEVRAEVRRQLEGLGYTKYKVDEGGVIRVPKEDYDRLFLDMVGLGVFNDDQLFKWLEEVNITSTTWDKKQRMNVTVQRRLENMIRQLDGVHDARVQLAPATDPRVVGGTSSPAKATVKVTLKPGKQELSQTQVNGIASMVAGAVGELQPWNVTIMDNRKLYRVPSSKEEWRAAEHRLALQQETERHFEEKLKKLLEPYAMEFGTEIPAQVFIRLSTDHVTEESLKQDVENVVKVRNEKYDKTVNNRVESSVAGVEKNAQVVGRPESTHTQNETESKKNEFNVPNQTTTRRTSAPGAIASVSVAIAIPVTYTQSPDEVSQRISEDRRKAIEQALTKGMSAFAGSAGLTEIPVSVQVVPIKKAPEEAEKPAATDWGALIREYWLTGLLGLVVLIAIICISIIGMRGVRRAKELPVEQILKITEEGVEIPPELPAEAEIQKVRETIKAMVQKNPRTVAGILKRWVLEK